MTINKIEFRRVGTLPAAADDNTVYFVQDDSELPAWVDETSCAIVVTDNQSPPTGYLASGLRGPDGPQGLQGPAGPQGPQGVQGEQGPAGSVESIPEFEITGTTSRNMEANRDYNLLNSSASACVLLGGTQTLPNMIGIEHYVGMLFATAGQTAFAIADLGFTLTNLSPRDHIRILRTRATDGLNFSYSIGSGDVAVNAYGGTSVTLTITPGGEGAPAAGDRIVIMVWGADDDAASNPTLATISGGYNALVNSIQTYANSAHSFSSNNGGHNGLLYGSYNGMGSNASYCGAGGLGNLLGMRASTVYSGAFGVGNTLDGIASYIHGQNNDVQGNGVSCRGESHRITHDYIDVSGRRGQSFEAYERILAGGRSVDTVRGIHAGREKILVGKTTNDTITSLQLANGSTGMSLVADTAMVFRIDGSASDSGATKGAGFSGTFVATFYGGIARINNLTTDVTVPLIHDQGSSGYTMSVRALGGKIQVRVTGAVDETVRWTAVIFGTQTLASDH